MSLGVSAFEVLEEPEYSNQMVKAYWREQMRKNPLGIAETGKKVSGLHAYTALRAIIELQDLKLTA